MWNLNQQNKRTVRMSMNVMEAWMKLNERGKHVNKIGNLNKSGAIKTSGSMPKLACNDMNVWMIPTSGVS